MALIRAATAAASIGRRHSNFTLLSIPIRASNPLHGSISYHHIKTGFRYSVQAVQGATADSITSDKEINGKGPPNSPGNWKVKMLYDGDCPLCMREEWIPFVTSVSSPDCSKICLAGESLISIQTPSSHFPKLQFHPLRTTTRLNASSSTNGNSNNGTTLRHVSDDGGREVWIPSASAIVAEIRKASNSPVEFVQRIENGKMKKKGLVLPSHDFQRLCIEQLDLFRRIVNPNALLSVNMLIERNKNYEAIKFVDISSDQYSPDDNQGLDYKTAMGRIHAILSDGTVVKDVEAFRKLYEAVGLGWVYAITKYEPVATIADAVYGVWAKYRLQVTGRPPLEQVLEARKKKEEICNDGKACKM